MCLAMLALPGKTIPEEHIKHAANVNQDGGGFAYVHTDKDGKQRVVVDKGYRSGEALYKAYLQVMEDEPRTKEFPFLVHFRIATMGEKSKENMHPFPTEHGALIHNGSFFYLKDTVQSDTCLFAADNGSVLDYDNVSKVNKELSNAVGNYNKVAFLYHSGKYQILNENAGQWLNGVWYSNGSFRKYRY